MIFWRESIIIMTSFEDLPNEILVLIFEYVPYAPRIRGVSKQFNDIVKDIEERVFKNPNKYIEELSAPVYFLLKNNVYHKSIWDKAIVKGNSDLLTELNALEYDPEKHFWETQRDHHNNLIKFFTGYVPPMWNEGMKAVIKAEIEGREKLIDFFIDHVPTNWDWGIQNDIKEAIKI